MLPVLSLKREMQGRFSGVSLLTSLTKLVISRLNETLCLERPDGEPSQTFHPGFWTLHSCAHIQYQYHVHTGRQKARKEKKGKG